MYAFSSCVLRTMGCINFTHKLYSYVSYTITRLLDLCKCKQIVTIRLLQIMYAKDVDQRSSAFVRSLAMGRDFQRRTKVLRSALINDFVLLLFSVTAHVIL